MHSELICIKSLCAIIIALSLLSAINRLPLMALCDVLISENRTKIRLKVEEVEIKNISETLATLFDAGMSWIDYSHVFFRV